LNDTFVRSVLSIGAFSTPRFLGSVLTASAGAASSSSSSSSSPKPSSDLPPNYYSPVRILDSDIVPPPWAGKPQQAPSPRAAAAAAMGPASPIEHIARLYTLRRYPDIFDTTDAYVASGELPRTLNLYELLFAACASAPLASQEDRAFGLLKEMETHGVLPSSAVYHSLLKLLAKSPELERRRAVLEEMQSRWFHLTDDGWAWVVKGYLRARQLEMALDMVLEREDRGLVVKTTVYRDLCKCLIEVGEVEEALGIMEKVEAEEVGGSCHWSGALGKQARLRMWYELLVAAAREMNLEVARAAWDKALGTTAALPLFVPDSGVRLLVLYCAARRGDVRLAEDVVNTCVREGETMREHHYAALIEAYAPTGAVAKIFETLVNMRGRGVPPEPNTTRAAIPVLAKTRESADAAAALLWSCRLHGDDVDLAAVELVMSLYVHLGDPTAAYAVLHGPDPSPPLRPATSTFNILLRGCATAAAAAAEASRMKDFAMYLASEMRELKIRPDADSYESLVRVCLNAVTTDGGGGGGGDPYFDVFLYVEEMKSMGYKLGRRAYEMLAAKCVEMGELQRAEMVMAEMEKTGWSARAAQEFLVRNWKRRGGEEKAAGGGKEEL
jgi:hypothetical protein